MIDLKWLLLDMVITWRSYSFSEVPRPKTLSSFYSVNLVMVRLGFLLVRFYLTKSLSTLPFVCYVRVIGLTLTFDDVTMLSNNNPVRVSLHEGERQLVQDFSAFVLVPFVATNIRTPARLVEVVTTQSTINHDGTYVIPTTIDIIDGLSLTQAKSGRLTDVIRKFELLHFGCVAQWKTFR
jgi:hypothetical protein